MPEEPTRKDTDVVLGRVGAQIIDNVLSFSLAVLQFAFFFAIGASLESTGEMFTGLEIISGLVLLPVILFGYEPLLEYLWNGQTVGKKALSIKVVKEDGSEIGGSEAFIRNIPVLGFIIPYFGAVAYPVALISMSAGDKRQRIFDRLAGTLVVKEDWNSA